MNRCPTATILGAGIAGLSAGIALDGAGYDVTVYERAPSLEPLGAALSLWPNAMAALRRLGAADLIEREAAPIPAFGAMNQAGRWLFGPLEVTRHDGCGAFLPTRALLQHALLDRAAGMEIKLGVDVQEVGLEDG